MMNDLHLRDPGTFRLLWRFPNLLFPTLIAVTVQWFADTVFRSASAVAPGDSGALLFIRVLASVAAVILPAVVWAGTLIVTTVTSAEAWEAGATNWQNAVAAARFGILPRRLIFAVLAGGYVVFLLLGVVINHVADLAFAATLYFFVIALPAIVVDGRPVRVALDAARMMGVRYPIYLFSAFVLPAVVILVAAVLATISLDVPFFGTVAAALSTAFAVTFAVTHVTGVYLDAERAGEAEIAELGPPLPETNAAEIIDGEFIRTNYPPYQ